MVRIPGFQGRNRISLDVPRETAPQANPIYNALSGLGQEGAKIGLQLMSERKQVADLRDVDKKFLQFNTELVNIQDELTNAMEEDGTLNPQVFGYKDKDTLSKYTYTEKLAEFFDERSQAYSKTAASKESRASFLTRFNPIKNESLIKAEAKVLEMEARETLRIRDEVGFAITNGISIQPALEIPDLANSAADFWQGENELKDKGKLDAVTFNTRNKAWSREMTIGALDNFSRNQRAEDMLSLIFAGNMPSNFEEVINQALQIQTQGGLAELDRQYKDIIPEDELTRMKQRFSRAMSIDPELLLQYRNVEGKEPTALNTDVEKLSKSLNRNDIEKYLRDAMKVMSQRALGGERTIRAEHEALNRRMEEGRNIPLSEIRNVIDKAAGLAGASDNPDDTTLFTHKLTESLLAGRKGKVKRESLFMGDQEFKEYYQAIMADPKADVYDMLVEAQNMLSEVSDFKERLGYERAIEFYKGVLRGENAQVISLAREEHAKEMPTLRGQQREMLKTDPGGLFDATLSEVDAKLYATGPARINKMEEVFNNFNLPPHYRKYVSKSEIDSFKVAWDQSPSSGAKVDMIESLKQNWGGNENWFKVADQYVKEAGLPPAMKIAMMLPNRLSMESFISVMSPGRDKLIRQAFAENNPDQDIQAAKMLFNDAVMEVDQMRDFLQGVAGMEDSSIDALENIAPIKESIGLFAMHTFNQKGGSFFGDNAYESAMRAATQEIVGKNFHVVSDGNSSIFAPKTPMSATPYPNEQQLASFLKKFSDPKVVAALAKAPLGFNELASEFAVIGTPQSELWERQVSDKFYWAVAPDMSGLQLRFREQSQRSASNDPLSPYSGVASDGERAIILPWSRVLREAGGR